MAKESILSLFGKAAHDSFSEIAKDLSGADAKVKEFQKSLGKLGSEMVNIRQKWQNKLLSQSNEKIAILEREKKREIELAETTGADTLDIERYYANEREKLEKSLTAKKIAESEQWINSAVGAVNRIGNLFSALSRNEEMRLDREYKERREYIEQNVVDEEERTAQLDALNEEQEAKKLALQKENAAREKALASFNAIVNTASAVTKALTAGPIAGPIMAGIIAGLGAAEIGLIASTPEPFYAGGLIKGSKNGILAQIGERNQDEAVLPMERATKQIADGVVGALQGRGQTGTGAVEHHTHLHVGTLIADDKGLKELERKMRPIRIAEDRRTGIA